MSINMPKIAMVLVASMGASFAAADEAKELKLQVERVKQTPDLTQTDNRAGFAGGGKQFCCPVAVSNALMLWSDRGADGLLPLEADSQPFDQQRKMTAQLASPDFMGTNLDTGTGVGGMIRGTQRYIAAANYKLASTEYYGWRKGWRPKSSERAKRGDLPKPSWMREILHKPYGAVWLNIGWYKITSPDKYQRLGGHWVLLAAYHPSEKNLFFIFDPSARSGTEKHADRITLQQLKSGLLEGEISGLPTTAVGRYRVDGMAMKRSVDVAIVDAAVAMVLAKPQ